MATVLHVCGSDLPETIPREWVGNWAIGSEPATIDSEPATIDSEPATIYSFTM